VGISVDNLDHPVDKVQRHDNRRDHVLRRPLEAAVQDALRETEQEVGLDLASSIAEKVLVTLDEQRVIQYAPKGMLSLLTPAGRVLVCLAENPAATLREISLILGVSESNVTRSVSYLVKAGVIARTKVKGRNTYSVVLKVAENHPDIRRFKHAISALLDGTFKQASDIT